MAFPSEVEVLQKTIDQIIDQYSVSSDVNVQKIIRKLKRVRKKLDPADALITGYRILWLADKIKDWLDQLP